MRVVLLVAALICGAYGLTLMETLQSSENPELSTLAGVVAGVPVIESLLSNTAVNTTLFAPTNEAFSKITPPTGEALENLLKYHAAAGYVLSSDLSDNQLINTLLLEAKLDDKPQVLEVTINNTNVYINNVALVQIADITADNGVIHVITEVLTIPPLLSDIVDNTGILSTLKAAIGAAGVADLFSTSNTLTVFAPTDEAFTLVDNAVLGYLLTDDPKPKALLTNLLQYHVVNGTVYSQDIALGDTLVPTLSGEDLNVNRLANVITINQAATVIVPNVLAENGVAHVIDQVLVPPGMTFDVEEMLIGLKAFKMLEYLNTTGLLGWFQLNPQYTLFAPVDAAFAGINVNEDELTRILQYHIIAGQTLISSQIKDDTVYETLLSSNGTLTNNFQSFKFEIPNDFALYVITDDLIPKARVTEGDHLTASSGVIHSLSQVLIPPSNVFAVLEKNAQTLSTLAGVIKQTDSLEAVVATTSSITLFAPTNAAFAALPPGIVDFLLANRDDSKEALVKVLSYHLSLSGVFYAPELPLNTPVNLTTADGEILLVERKDNQGDSIVVLLNNKITVEFTDLMASNGVVHTIDGVLIPPSVVITTQDILIGLDTFSVLITAVVKTGNTGVVTGTTEYTIFAPNDEAFSRVEDLQALVNNDDKLDKVLKNHIVQGRVDNLKEGDSFVNLNGLNLTILSKIGNDWRVKLEDPSLPEDELIARITLSTNGGSNGNIYELDEVLGVVSDEVESSGGDGDSLEGWAIALIVIAGFVVIAIIAAAVVFGVYKYRQSNDYDVID